MRTETCLDHLVSLVAQPTTWDLAGTQKQAATLSPASEAERTLGSVLPCRKPCASFSGKGHMRGVSSAGLEIESWHLLSTWILCQASCICGFIYMPSRLLLKAPALAEPSAETSFPQKVFPLASFRSLLQCGSCHCPCPGHCPLPPPCFVFLCSLGHRVPCYVCS